MDKRNFKGGVGVNLCRNLYMYVENSPTNRKA